MRIHPTVQRRPPEICGRFQHGTVFHCRVSNSGEINTGDTLVAWRTPGWNYQVASGFTVSTSANYSLNSISIISGVTNDLTDLRMNIYADNSGEPGSLLTTFTGSGTNYSSFTFSPVSAFTLITGNSYFWAIEALTDGTYMEAASTGSFDQSGDPGWSIYDGAYLSGFTPGTWFLVGDVTLFSVDATAIPEPSSALLGIGAVALLTLRRRR